MHYDAHVFVRPESNLKSLEQFARTLFSMLGITRFEERGMPNQCEGSCFFGAAVGVEVRIGDANERRLPDYQYLVSFGPQDSNQSADYLNEHAHILARRWSHDGWRCFVPKDLSTFLDERDGMVYVGQT